MIVGSCVTRRSQKNCSFMNESISKYDVIIHQNLHRISIGTVMLTLQNRFKLEFHILRMLHQ